ncbi:hypothetical protein RFI_19435 [Reticulomyxa filosa]|uniref:Uncharacterized protein n=1 Tax=Reticulomyxa filosa TaxID=46433 RepID=X6MVM9_RETFI|nr:hypothetical protein RFI_19435 [Reticulomyxa filosa]|eukprot:ETO17869.1 hypothetical protein RFI_19435 [Reticulomyxa filosa]
MVFFFLNIFSFKKNKLFFLVTDSLNIVKKKGETGILQQQRQMKNKILFCFLDDVQLMVIFDGCGSLRSGKVACEEDLLIRLQMKVRQRQDKRAQRTNINVSKIISTTIETLNDIFFYVFFLILKNAKTRLFL